MASTCSEAPGRPLDPVNATKALPRPLPARPWRDGHRNGHRDRQLDTTFGPVVLPVPRARLADPGGEREWRSALLPAYRRLSRRTELMIAQVYLRRGQHPAGAPCAPGPVRRPPRQGCGEARLAQDALGLGRLRQRRHLRDEDILQLILDDTVVKVLLDRKATSSRS